jgi:hypothetical protein
LCDKREIGNLKGRTEAEIDEILDGGAKTEEEQPIENLFNKRVGQDDIETRKLEKDEKDKDRKEKRYFSAFRLIIGCLVFLGIIYLIDVIMSALLKREITEITGSIIEIIKTLLFTLSGYLFARKENGD